MRVAGEAKTYVPITALNMADRQLGLTEVDAPLAKRATLKVTPEKMRPLSTMNRIAAARALVESLEAISERGIKRPPMLAFVTPGSGFMSLMLSR